VIPVQPYGRSALVAAFGDDQRFAAMSATDARR
jgi:hypothetical protein